MKIIATAILVAGMSTAAFAQSNPAPAGSTIDKNHGDTGGGANTDMKKPKAVDTTSTGSTMDKTKCANPASSAGTGKLQTQGGKSNATPEDEACAAHNN